jgi:hypothetical protein
VQGNKDSARGANTNLDWKECVEALKDSRLAELSDWRVTGLDIWKVLRSQEKIGLYKGHIAFAVHNAESQVVGCHYLSDQQKKQWQYTPGVKLAPFIIGDIDHAKVGHAFESQWDQVAFCDKTSAHLTDGILTLSTRGAKNPRLLADVFTSEKEIFLWPQNDDAGETWVERVPRIPEATLRVVRSHNWGADYRIVVRMS